VMPLPVLLASTDTLNLGEASLLAGSSETFLRTDHFVACESGRIVRDLGGKGIDSPASDGSFWTTYVGACRRSALD